MPLSSVCMYVGMYVCLLPYEPRVKLLNNGNVVGLRFGFQAVPVSDHRVAGSNPA